MDKALLLGIITALTLAFTPGCHPVDKAPSSAETERARRGYAATPHALAQLEREEKQARHTKGYTKPDGPNAFFSYHQQIRTPLGTTSPAYTPDYRLRALRASLRRMSKAQQQLDWKERGPANVSGRTRALVVDPDDPAADTWVVGSAGGGIWKTTNAGTSWRNLTPDLPNLATVSLAQGRSNADVLYAGTGEGFFNIDAIGGDGIFKSTDRGETWVQLSATSANPDFDAVNRLIVDPDNAEVVLAATNRGLFRSSDGGTSWVNVYDSKGYRVQQVMASPDNFDVQFATINQYGVIKSIDAGRTWTLSFDWTEHYTPHPTNGRMELAFAPSNTQRTYLAVQSTSASDLFVAVGQGLPWTKVEEASGAAPNWLGGQGWYNNAIAVHPYDRLQVYVGGINLWRVDDDRWDPAKRTTHELTNWYPGRASADHPAGVFPYVHADHHSLTIVPFDEATERFRIIGTNDGGVAYSDDGGLTWTQAGNGYNTAQFYGVDKRPGADEYLGGMQDNGTWRSADNVAATAQTLWQNQLGGDGFDVAWHNEDARKMIGASQFNNIWRSVDGGQTWRPSVGGIADVTFGGLFFSTIAEARHDPDLLFTTTHQGIWRSDTFGERWTATRLDSIGRWFDNTFRIPTAVSVADPQVVWAGGAMSENYSLFVSEDGGLSFRATASLPDIAARVTGLATHPAEPQTAYALFSIADAPKILRTQDLGKTWESLSGSFAPGAALSSNGFPNVAVYALLAMPFDPDVLWAGTEIGLFVSEDAGANWSRADNGLPAVSIWQMRIVDDQVVVATHGRGVWSISLPELASHEALRVVRAPRLNEAALAPDGRLTFDLSLRSAYDSLAVLLDSVVVSRAGAVAQGAMSLVLPLPLTETRRFEASVVAYRHGRAYRSASESVTVFPVEPFRVRYQNDFARPLGDFIGDDFSVRNEARFSSTALHSPHYYPNQRTYITQLRHPIRVAAYSAILHYRDVALIEPGEPGSMFGDAEFWDYAVVEGSKDGLNWTPLADGYDARYHPDWLAVYEQDGRGFEELFVAHQIDLHDTFAPGDVIFIRFRLFADQRVDGWGWVIDDVRIQPDAPVATEDPDGMSSRLALEPSFPNPFRAETTLRYHLPRPERVTLMIYDLRGRRVCTLVDADLASGQHEARWDGRDDAGMPLASGVYLGRLHAGRASQSIQIVLLR